MRKETINYQLTDSDIIRINEALKTIKIRMPKGMSREEKRAFIISKAK